MAANDRLHAIGLTISDHVVAPHGAALLAVTAMCGLVAGLVLMSGLGSTGLTTRAGVQLLLAGWCLGVVVAIAFPRSRAQRSC